MSTIQQESYDLEFTTEGASIALYDSNFFYVTENPVTVPKIIKQGTPSFNTFYLEVTEITKMNTVSHPCESSLTYSFTKCIRQFFVKVQFSCNLVPNSTGVRMCRFSFKINLVYWLQASLGNFGQ